MSRTDLSLIYKHFQTKDPKIYEVIKMVNYDDWFPAGDAVRTVDSIFTQLCREIVGQQLSGKAAGTIFGRFKSLFKSEHLDPKEIMAVDKQKLRDAGLSWAKASYVQNLAEHVYKGLLQLEKIHELPDEEVIRELVAVKGIGQWTAEMFLMFNLARENIFSYGDLGLKKGLMKVYGMKKEPTKDRIAKIIKKWEPYKSYGSIALWRSLEAEGPTM